MRGDVRDGLLEVRVHVELGDLVLEVLVLEDGDLALFRERLAHELADLVVLRDALGADVAGAGERCEDVGHLFCGVDEGFCFVVRLAVEGLRPQAIGERFEAALAGDDGAGAFLRLVGEVEVFELGLCLDFEELLFQVVGELALAADLGEHCGAALFELLDVAGALLDGADLHLVEVACGLLAVAGDERDGGALGEELHDSGHAGAWEVQLGGERRHRIEAEDQGFRGAFGGIACGGGGGVFRRHGGVGLTRGGDARPALTCGGDWAAAGWVDGEGRGRWTGVARASAGGGGGGAAGRWGRDGKDFSGRRRGGGLAGRRGTLCGAPGRERGCSCGGARGGRRGARVRGWARSGRAG